MTGIMTRMSCDTRRGRDAGPGVRESAREAAGPPSAGRVWAPGLVSRRIPVLFVPFVLLVSANPLLAVEFVVDNDDGAPGYVETGNWTTSSSTGYAGGTYRYTMGGPESVPASATWMPDLPSSRRYLVYAAYRQSTNRTTNAPVTIAHAEGTTIVSLDQSGDNTMVETLLGEFHFEAGTNGWVRMDSGDAPGAYIADAVVWRTPTDPPPVISGITRTPEAPGGADSVFVSATVTDNGSVATVEVSYAVSPSGASGSVTAYDDGAHGDGPADDQVYGAVIPPQTDDSIVTFWFSGRDDLGQLSQSVGHYYAVGPLPTSVPDVVVDNDDGAPGYVETGSWTTSSLVGYEGGTYRYAPGVSGEATSSASWTATLPRSGVWRVYAAFARGANRTFGAPMTVTHAMGTTVVDVNQYGSSGIVEVLLGEFPFDAAEGGSVRMDNNGAPGIYIADAMIWRLPADPPPSVSLVTRNPIVPSESDPVAVTARLADNAEVSSGFLHYTVSPSGVSESVTAYDDGVHGDGAADDGVYGATIPPQPSGFVVSFHCTAWDNLGQSTDSPEQHYVVGEQGGDVYIVLSSDTSVWHGTPGLSPGSELSWDVFASRTGVLSRVFDGAFRHRNVDSLGRPFKVSWFMMGGAWFLTATNSTAISALYHIRDNWGDDIEAWGDGLDYHFHHYAWEDETWSMAPTFSETIWEYEWVMSEMMIDEDVFVTAFRSGWNYMDDVYQQYLERWLPFRMEGRQANWTPYHPSFEDWQTPGTMKGWEARHIYTKSLAPSHVEQAFSAALGGVDQVMCIWSHQNEADFPQQIEAVDGILHQVAATHPSVRFHYCSAREAMQHWLDHEPGHGSSPLEVVPTVAGNDVDVTILTADDIYQEQPWVAARKYSGEYVRLDTTKTASGAWRFGYSRLECDRVKVGVSDVYGNEAIAEVDDGSRRWAVQSEFAGASPSGVDLDSAPTRVRLAQGQEGFVSPGTVTFEHTAGSNREWESIVVTGDAPAGTSLRCRYRIADTGELLDDAPWSEYRPQGTILLQPPESRQACLRVEVLLEGTPEATPELDSVEVFYGPLASAVGHGYLMLR